MNYKVDIDLKNMILGKGAISPAFGESAENTDLKLKSENHTAPPI